MHKLSSYKQVLAIAVPVSLKLFLDMAMILIDLFMVGKLGINELTAVGMGLFLLSATAGVLDNLFATGGGLLVARLTGAQQHQKVFQVLTSMLIIAIPLYLLTLVIALYSEEIYLLFRTTVEVAELGVDYFGTLLIGSLFIYLDVLLFTYFVSIGNSKLPMQLKIISLMFNMLFNYLFIFGNLGAPKLGIQGAAIGTIAATALTVCFYVVVLLRDRLYPVKWVFSVHYLKQILKLGMPSMIESITFQASWLFIIALINSYALSVAAGFQIGFRVESIAFLPGLGTAAAAATLVSRFIGAQDNQQAAMVTLTTAKITVLFMGIMGGLMVIMPEALARVFTDDSATIADAAIYIRVIGLSQIPLGLQFVYSAALRAHGDLSRTAMLKILLLWVNIVIPAMIIVHLGYPVLWLFAVISFANFIDAAVFICRYQQVRTKNSMIVVT